MIRPSWDDYFAGIAEQVATRSTCPRLAVGAVLVLDKRILATGYNGAMSGDDHCTEVGCDLLPCQVHQDHCTRAKHAEANVVDQTNWLLALFEADYWDEGECQKLLARTVLYLTHAPCPRCLTQLNEAGITQVRHQLPYRSGYAEGNCSLLGGPPLALP